MTWHGKIAMVKAEIEPWVLRSQGWCLNHQTNKVVGRRVPPGLKDTEELRLNMCVEDVQFGLDMCCLLLSREVSRSWQASVVFKHYIGPSLLPMVHDCKAGLSEGLRLFVNRGKQLHPTNSHEQIISLPFASTQIRTHMHTSTYAQVHMLLHTPTHTTHTHRQGIIQPSSCMFIIKLKIWIRQLMRYISHIITLYVVSTPSHHHPHGKLQVSQVSLSPQSLASVPVSQHQADPGLHTCLPPTHWHVYIYWHCQQQWFCLGTGSTNLGHIAWTPAKRELASEQKWSIVSLLPPRPSG